jgi:hypothetical protein
MPWSWLNPAAFSIVRSLLRKSACLPLTEGGDPNPMSSLINLRQPRFSSIGSVIRVPPTSSIRTGLCRNSGQVQNAIVVRRWRYASLKRLFGNNRADAVGAGAPGPPSFPRNPFLAPERTRKPGMRRPDICRSGWMSLETASLHPLKAPMLRRKADDDGGVQRTPFARQTPK